MGVNVAKRKHHILTTGGHCDTGPDLCRQLQPCSFAKEKFITLKNFGFLFLMCSIRSFEEVTKTPFNCFWGYETPWVFEMLQL